MTRRKNNEMGRGPGLQTHQFRKKQSSRDGLLYITSISLRPGGQICIRLSRLRTLVPDIFETGQTNWIVALAVPAPFWRMNVVCMCMIS